MVTLVAMAAAPPQSAELVTTIAALANRFIARDVMASHRPTCSILTRLAR
jgi:hypothetical protein